MHNAELSIAPAKPLLSPWQHIRSETLVSDITAIVLEYHCLIQVYDDQLWSSLEQVLLLPLCQRIETDLRLHHHAALLTGVPPMNPLSTDMLDVTPLLEVDTLQLSTRAVDIR